MLFGVRLVILTRFSRVTFNAAHKYLGLTTEVLRTEKAINDIACHPLPPSFYEGGGLRHLRQRFDGVSANDSDSESDYFSFSTSTAPSRNSSKTSLPLETEELRRPNKDRSTGTSSPERKRSSTPFRGSSGRQYVQAGDLHSTTTNANDNVRPYPRTRSSLYTPMPTPALPSRDLHGAQRLTKDDFDLRDEVMSCIAKSIGLLQPPLSGEESVEASPAFAPSEGGRSRPGSMLFGSSFGSLTLLGMGDDEASSMTASSTGTGDGYLSGLDNEVEILYFPAGSILAKAGDINTGEYSLSKCK